MRKESTMIDSEILGQHVMDNRDDAIAHRKDIFQHIDVYLWLYCSEPVTARWFEIKAPSLPAF
jgi:hypothetical protein